MAENWQSYCEKYEISLQVARQKAEDKKTLEQRKEAFLNANAVKKVRVRYEDRGLWFYETNKEMDGKYGWFSSYGKSYNMTEYYTGWDLQTEENYREFFKIN